LSAVETAARAAFDRRLDPGSPAPVVVALSGGGDSMALLWLAAAWAGTHKRPLLAITVDHRLNPASRDWSRFAATAASRAGAGFLTLEWQGVKPATGLPAAARAARHRLLALAAREAGARALLTGHTADDVDEGERMREADAPGLGRLREWSPSPAWPEGRGLFLLRPLLETRREALRDFLRARGEPWLDDPANADPRFARSRARAALNTSSSAGAQRRPEAPANATVKPQKSDAESPERLGSRVYGSSSLRPRMTEDGRFEIPRAAFAGPGGAALLSTALLCAAGTDRPPRGLQVEGLLERLVGTAPVDATLAGARLTADAETVQVGRDAGERFRGGLASQDLAAGATLVWDGRFEVTAEAPGLQVAALGGAMARLDRPDRARLKAFPPWARGALPALVGADGSVRLPRPLGAGPASATPLAGARLAAACGWVARESDIDHPPHGAAAVVTLCSGPLP